MTDAKKFLDVIAAVAKKISAEKDFLTELDNEIGDGDHGINLARGFNAVEEILPTLADKDIGAILKSVGMKLVSTVGGASGPLYGTAFMKAGNVAKGKFSVTDVEFVEMFTAAVDGIKMRGKSTEGEKTMLDALCPALTAIKNSLGDGKNLSSALADGVDAAAKGVEFTKTIVATKGRASYLQERSLGHQDPGATSSLFMLQVAAEILRGGD